MKRLRITVEGKVYDVVVEMLDEIRPSAGPIAASAAPPPTPAPAAAAPAPAAAAASGAPAGPGAVTSPLAGKVVSIQAPVGTVVKEGDVLLTIEAMKMNTYVNAPRAGKVTAVLVAAGDSVEEGQTLAQLG